LDGPATNPSPDRHYVAAVEATFRAYGPGQAEAPPPTHIAMPHGMFHVMRALYRHIRERHP